eukprot:3938212-Amphidinium_carterae.2
MDMIWGPQTTVVCSTEDCADYFYLLRMPTEREQDTVIGYSLAGHQLCRELVEASGLEFAEHRLYSIALLTVAMGDIKAMELGQAVHQTVLLHWARLPTSGWITLGWQLGDGPHYWGAYCDDFAQLSLMEPGSSIERFRPASVLRQARAQLSDVHSAYHTCKLVRKEEKAELEVSCPTFWGATVDSQRGVLHGHEGKLRSLVLATCSVLRRRYVTCAMIERLIGYWTHHALFLRMALSVLQDVYVWVRKHVDSRHRLRPLPASVRDELLGMLALWPDLECQLRTPPSSKIYASDASQSLAGVVCADMDLQEAVLMWSLRTSGVAKGTAILSDAGLYQLSREEVRNDIFEDLLRSKAFSLVTAYRFTKQNEHINVKELLAARTAIRAAAASPEVQGSRVTIAIDSQVVVWVLRKGRSSSRKLNRIMQSCLCWALSGQLRVQAQWVSTEANPADDPSRRAAVREAEVRSPSLQAALSEVECVWPWAAEMTRLLWNEQQSFDKCKGYPGEGPAVKRTSDLRISVQPATVKRYAQCVKRVEAWLTSEKLPSLAELCKDVDSLSIVLAAFIQFLHNNEQPYTHAVEALAGIQFFFPQVQRSLQTAWRAVKTWGMAKPIQVRSPMPLPVLLALVTAALTQGWDRTACVMLMGFEALLRPSEMGGCLRMH